jgi:hypothetical protein
MPLSHDKGLGHLYSVVLTILFLLTSKVNTLDTVLAIESFCARISLSNMKIKVYSYDRSDSVDVEVENVEENDYQALKADFLNRLESEQAYSAISHCYVDALKLCPDANPSDVWQHIMYRIFIESGKNEQSWKRASGQAFENAFADIYNPRLEPHGIRLRVMSNSSAVEALESMGLTGKIAPSKIDIILEAQQGEFWEIFGVVHAKTSIAERIKDDAPASHIIMQHGFFSVLATLDSKSFPPPHGNGINYGELGGRTAGKENNGTQPKRAYFEVDGDFNFGYSYNLRTPATQGETQSGSSIKTLSFSEEQPDLFVTDVLNFWKQKSN